MGHIYLPTLKEEKENPNGPPVSEGYSGQLVYSYGIWQTPGKEVGEIEADKSSMGDALNIMKAGKWSLGDQPVVGFEGSDSFYNTETFLFKQATVSHSYRLPESYELNKTLPEEVLTIFGSPNSDLESIVFCLGLPYNPNVVF